jgi:hypothetical protein
VGLLALLHPVPERPLGDALEEVVEITVAVGDGRPIFRAVLILHDLVEACSHGFFLSAVAMI